jgi:predicted PurR-regulated permease PerM
VLIIIGIVLGTMGVLYMLGGVFDRVHTTLIDIVFAILFAYIVYPPIKWVAARFKVPVPIAGLIVYVLLGALVSGALIWLAPAVASQATELAHDYPMLAAKVQTSLADPAHSPLLARLPDSARNAVAANAAKVGQIAAGAAAAFGEHALRILSGTTAVVINTALALVLALLFIGDLAQIQAFAIRLVPRAARAAAIDFTMDVDKVVGGFARGQVLLALVVAAAGTIVLLIAGVPYAILLGLLAGLISIVPMVGAFIALIPVGAITYATTLDPIKTIVVVVLFLIITQVQQQVLIPLVVAKSVGVTPLVIFLALLFGSEAFGILGALLSIPIAGILRVAAERLFPHDADADAEFAAARERAREPISATVKAIVD